MLRPVVVALAVASVVLASWVASSQPGSPPSRSEAPVSRPVPSSRLGIIPAPAGAQGQWLLQRGAGSAVFSEKGLALHLPSRQQPSRELGWRVAGARAVTPRAERRQPGTFHRMNGPKETWERGLPIYSGLRYPGVLPGVDLWFEEQAEGVEYGFRAERGRDLRRVKLEYAGAKGLRVVEEGRALEVVLEEGVVREEGLRCAQEALDGTSREVGCRFAQARAVGRERWEYAIEVDVEDPERPVVVDPLIRWSTYLGGGFKDVLRDMLYTDDGLYVIGSSGSAATPPAVGQQADVYLARFDPTGTRQWEVRFGGAQDDHGVALAIRTQGKLVIAGTTASSTWAQNPSDLGTGRKLMGKTDGFIAQLDPQSGQLDLEWLVYVGGSQEDEVHDLAVVGNYYFVVGETRSEDLPGIRADTKAIRGKEAFFTRLAPISTSDKFKSGLLQGQNDESAKAIIESPPYLYITGSTNSPLPDGGLRDGKDVFLSRMTPSLTEPLFGPPLYLGGAGEDEGRALIVRSGEVLLVGSAESSLSPAGNAAAGGSDIFLAPIDTALFSLAAPVTLLPGPGDDEVFTATLDSSQTDVLFVGGQTTAALQVPDGGDGSVGGLVDGFVARVDLNTNALEWASLIGGSQTDEVRALQLLERGRLFIGGTTTSADLLGPDAGSHDDTYNGEEDIFLLRMETDNTPPLKEDARVFDGPVPEQDIEEQEDKTSLSATWRGFTDQESDILYYECIVRDVTDPLTELAKKRVNLDVATEVTFTGLNLQAGHRYQVVVRAYNGAGLWVEQGSNGVSIPGEAPDSTPPTTEAAQVFDGPTAGVDIDAQKDTTTLSANWQGFADAESGILDYEYFARDVAAPSTELGKKRGTATSATFTGLTLQVGHRYEVVVRAYNGVGLWSEKSSDGVLIQPAVEPPGGGGTDGGTGGGPRSPMGYSCGCTSLQGSGDLALGALLGFFLLASRRREARR